MKVIVGLGNPGRKYENTRHNIGFITLDYLAEENNIKLNKLKFKSLVGEGNISGQKVLLAKPQTYMNLSGESVGAIMDYYRLEPEDLIVVYDDIDVPSGFIRIRKKGSAGSHNGMKSIIYRLGYDDFPRVRIGIGREEKRGELVDYVIGGFSRAEVPIMEDAVRKASAALACMLETDIDMAMNRYNEKPEKQKKDNKKKETVENNEDVVKENRDDQADEQK